MVDWLSDGSYIQWVSEPSRRLTLDLWLAKDNRFLNLKSSYKLVLSVQKVDQQGHEGEGKVLRVLLSMLEFLTVQILDGYLLNPWSIKNWAPIQRKEIVRRKKE